MMESRSKVIWFDNRPTISRSNISPWNNNGCMVEPNFWNLFNASCWKGTIFLITANHNYVNHEKNLIAVLVLPAHLLGSKQRGHIHYVRANKQWWQHPQCQTFISCSLMCSKPNGKIWLIIVWNKFYSSDNIPHFFLCLHNFLLSKNNAGYSLYFIICHEHRNKSGITIGLFYPLSLDDLLFCS